MAVAVELFGAIAAVLAGAGDGDIGGGAAGAAAVSAGAGAGVACGSLFTSFLPSFLLSFLASCGPCLLRAFSWLGWGRLAFRGGLVLSETPGIETVPRSGSIRMVWPPYSKVYCACAVLLASRNAAIANSLFIMTS